MELHKKENAYFFVGIKRKLDFANEIENRISVQKRKAPTIRELFRDLGPAGTERNPRTCNAKITFAVKPVM